MKGSHGGRSLRSIWGFPNIRGTFLGVPIIRTTVYWGLHWGPPILGNYHLEVCGSELSSSRSGLRV